MKRLMEKKILRSVPIIEKIMQACTLYMHFLSVSVGYVCLVALLLLAGVEDIMSNMSNGLILFLFLIILAGYVGVVIVYCGIASHIYNEKHKKARKRVKKYNHNLIQLLKMYEKEKR